MAATNMREELDQVGQAILKLGRFEGTAHGFRQTAAHLRAMADQLEEAAKQADEQAAGVRDDAIRRGLFGRARRALSAALAGWKGARS